jgi:hypothetical protein
MADETPVSPTPPPAPGEDNQPPIKPPDDLLFKGSELDDTKYVTEELARMKSWVHITLSIWFILLGAASIIKLIDSWPAAPTISGYRSTVDSLTQKLNSISTAIKTLPSDSALKVTNQITVNKVNPPVEQNKEDSSVYFLIAIFSGILGGSLHGLASLMDFRGQRRLFRSWAMWYFCLPIVGGMVSVIFLFILRAGLLPNASNFDVASPYGIAAFGALCGLFTDKATTKLSEIIDTIFTSSSSREGKLNINSGNQNSQTPKSGNP